MRKIYFAFGFILVIGIASAIIMTYHGIRESRIEQMTAEQVMKMLPQSVSGFTYGDLQTMKGIAEVQEWYNDIVNNIISPSSSTHMIDTNSIDYIIDAGSYLTIFGGKFDFEKIRKVCENYTIEEYKGYQILCPWSNRAAFAGKKNVIMSVIMLTDDKIVTGQIEVVRDFIDVLNGDNAPMYEDFAYDEIKSEITSGFIIRAGGSTLYQYGEKMLGYSVNQADGNVGQVKAVYVYDNQHEVTEAHENLENYVRGHWPGGNSAIIEQKGKAIVVTVTTLMQNIRNLVNWVTGFMVGAGEVGHLTFQNSVSWNAAREDNGNITVSYHDITGDTISANVKIENLAGQIENETNFLNTSTFSFTWPGAENSVAYKVVLTVQHNIFGDVSENKSV